MEVRFYHLQNQSIDQALPALVSKAYAGGHKIIIRTSDVNEAEKLNDILWTFRQDAFLPHGTAKDGHAEKQPIWISPENDNPNGANVLILTAGQEFEAHDVLDMVCDVFDGRHDESVQAARTRWKSYKDAGHEVTYWQQTANGGWDKKA